MAKNENTTDEGQETLTKEELKERRAEITAYYKDNIKDLKIQLEYEELLRDIEKTRAERLQAQMYIAQTMAPAPEESPSEETSDSKSKMKEEFDQSIKIDASSGAAGAKAAADQIKRTLKRQADGI